MTDGFETITAQGGKVITLTDYRESRDVSTMYHGDIESPSPTKSNPTDSEAHIIPSQDSKKAEVKKVEVKPKTMMTFTPNRRADGGRTIEGGVAIMKLTEQNLAKHDVRTGSVNPFVQNFTSPIGALSPLVPLVSVLILIFASNFPWVIHLYQILSTPLRRGPDIATTTSCNPAAPAFQERLPLTLLSWGFLYN